MHRMQTDHLEKLWKEYCCRLFAFIRGKVGDESEAEDILQEVFLRIHQGLCCRDEVTRMESWIYRVTRNLIVDHYRRRKPAAELPDTLVATEELPEDEDPRVRLAFSLRETIDELPQPYRDALLLTEYEGLSQQALAEKAGISLSGAKSRVQRAREKLRDLLLACCHFELDRQGRIIDYYERCCCCNPTPA
jgi:RNA polymerase sigma-70 factor, ECF subfamily